MRQWTRSSDSWCSTVCTTKHPSTSSTSASLSPVSPIDNIFTLSAEVFSSCLVIVSAVMVDSCLWPALRYGTGYQTVWEIRPSAETPSSIHWRRFYFQLTCVHSALELSDDALYKFTYLLTYLAVVRSYMCGAYYIPTLKEISLVSLLPRFKIFRSGLKLGVGSSQRRSH